MISARGQPAASPVHANDGQWRCLRLCSRLDDPPTSSPHLTNSPPPTYIASLFLFLQPQCSIQPRAFSSSYSSSHTHSVSFWQFPGAPPTPHPMPPSLRNHHTVKPEALTDKETPEIKRARQQSRLKVRAQHPGGAQRLQTLQIAPSDSQRGEPDNVKLPALVTGRLHNAPAPTPPPPPSSLYLHFCPLSLSESPLHPFR